MFQSYSGQVLNLVFKQQRGVLKTRAVWGVTRGPLLLATPVIPQHLSGSRTETLWRPWGRWSADVRNQLVCGDQPSAGSPPARRQGAAPGARSMLGPAPRRFAGRVRDRRGPPGPDHLGPPLRRGHPPPGSQRACTPADECHPLRPPREGYATAQHLCEFPLTTDGPKPRSQSTHTCPTDHRLNVPKRTDVQHRPWSMDTSAGRRTLLGSTALGQLRDSFPWVHCWYEKSPNTLVASPTPCWLTGFRIIHRCFSSPQWPHEISKSTDCG